jgi:RNA polymerase sigma factor (sigma-70 family)
MDENEWLTRQFEEHRSRLHALAYRMLGSHAEADDAVQDTWLRLSRAGDDQIDNIGGWLTTVVTRECLHLLRSRRIRREDLIGAQLPEPIIAADAGPDPAQEILLADSIGMALLLVLDRLPPAERVAFVLHDAFQLPFDEIARLTDRQPAAARQLASRARRRVRDAGLAAATTDVASQRKVVDAFFVAARAGDFDALIKLLDPNIVLRADFGPGRPQAEYRGTAQVSRFARAPRGAELHPVLVNGRVGRLVTIDGQPFSILVFTVADDKIVEIDAVLRGDSRGRGPGSWVRRPVWPARYRPDH